MSASLVLQTSFLGDMVLTTPLLAELAARGPVDVVATPASAPLLANHPAVRTVVVFDKRGADAGVGGLRRLAARLRARRYDAAYLAQGSTRTAVLALLAGVRTRVGFSTSAGRWLYTARVPYREDRHHAERLWRLAFPEGAPEPEPERVRPRLFPGEAERRAVDELLGGPMDDAESPLVALAPGSVWATKRWPYYPELARRLAPAARLAIIGGREDAALAEAIAGAIGASRVVDATGRLSLLGSAELLRRCRVLVTNDSAPQHLASAVDTPTVTIFGPTVPEFGFGPLARGSASLGHEALPCRPCDRHGPRQCPLGHWKCMRELAVDHVVRRVADVAALALPSLPSPLSPPPAP